MLTERPNIVFQVTATDLDSGSNGEISYNIPKGNTGDAFEIDAKGNHMAILNRFFCMPFRIGLSRKFVPAQANIFG